MELLLKLGDEVLLVLRLGRLVEDRELLPADLDMSPAELRAEEQKALVKMIQALHGAE